MRLDVEVKAAQQLKARLLQLPNADDDLVRDMIEGETKLHEAIAAVVKELACVEAEAEGMATAQKALLMRRQRHEARAEALRLALTEAMEMAELTSMKTPIASLSLRPAPPRVEIIDPAAIPAEYMVQPAPVPDKSAIRSDLKDGKAVPGCTLSNQPVTLSVRFT